MLKTRRLFLSSELSDQLRLILSSELSGQLRLLDRALIEAPVLIMGNTVIGNAKL